MKKSELRKIYLAKQKTISLGGRSTASHRIADLLFDKFDLTGIKFLHSFVSIEKLNEVDTRPIFELIWRHFPHIQTVVPRFDLESNEMKSLKFGPDTELVKSAWEIDEPVHDE